MLSRFSNRPVPGGGNRGPAPPEDIRWRRWGRGRGDGDGVHGFRQQLKRYRLGLLFTVASIVMLFISFTTLFVARRGAGKFDPLTGSFPERLGSGGAADEDSADQQRGVAAEQPVH